MSLRNSGLPGRGIKREIRRVSVTKSPILSTTTSTRASFVASAVPGALGPEAVGLLGVLVSSRLEGTVKISSVISTSAGGNCTASPLFFEKRMPW